MSVQVLMILAAVWPAAADPTKATRWEYRAMSGRDISELGKDNVEVGLNKLGQEGWELILVVPRSGENVSWMQAQHYFKRLSVKPAPPPDKAPAEDKGKTEIKVFRLQHAKAAEAARVLQGLFGKGAAIKIVADERTNSLLIMTGVEKLIRIAALVEVLDEPRPDAKARAAVQVVRLQNTKAVAVARVMHAFFGEGAKVRVVPDERTNSVLVSGTIPEWLKLKEIIKLLDRPKADVKGGP